MGSRRETSDIDRRRGERHCPATNARRPDRWVAGLIAVIATLVLAATETCSAATCTAKGTSVDCAKPTRRPGWPSAAARSAHSSDSHAIGEQVRAGSARLRVVKPYGVHHRSIAAVADRRAVSGVDVARVVGRRVGEADEPPTGAVRGEAFRQAATGGVLCSGSSAPGARNRLLDPGSRRPARRRLASQRTSVSLSGRWGRKIQRVVVGGLLCRHVRAVTLSRGSFVDTSPRSLAHRMSRAQGCRVLRHPTTTRRGNTSTDTHLRRTVVCTYIVVASNGNIDHLS